MIIKFKNLGPIEKGEIDLNDLKGINLIIGKNNTGKTYLSNLLYCYLKSKFQVTITVFNFLKVSIINDVFFSSKLLTGSSANNNLGCCANAFAIATLCF